MITGKLSYEMPSCIRTKGGFMLDFGADHYRGLVIGIRSGLLPCDSCLFLGEAEFQVTDALKVSGFFVDITEHCFRIQRSL